MMSAAAPAAFGATGRVVGGGGGGNGTAINFFGIRDISTQCRDHDRCLGLHVYPDTGDASGRKLVRHGKDQNFQVIREEAIKLVQSLTPQTRFGIVRWSGGAYSWKQNWSLQLRKTSRRRSRTFR